MDQSPPPVGPPPSENEPSKNKPILTKAIGSVICGLLSLHACFCFGVPSLVLGGSAIWLGVYVQRNYRDTTVSEIANIYAWAGIALGCVGLVLGIIGTVMLLLGSGAGLFSEITKGM